LASGPDERATDANDVIDEYMCIVGVDTALVNVSWVERPGPDHALGSRESRAAVSCNEMRTSEIARSTLRAICSGKGRPGSMAEDQHERADATRSRRGDGLTNRLGRRDGPGGGNRPRSVYAVLVAGVAALLALLLIIYFSSDRDTPEQPICTTVDVTTAREAVLEGRIQRITMAYDDAAAPPSADNWGPVLARLDYTDGQCANLPQGIVSQDDIYLITGTIKIFNDITENQQIEIKYDRQTALDAALFTTPTPEPTTTPEVTPTAEATDVPTRTTDGGVIPPVASPVATHEASPAVTPEATPIATPEADPTP
jgi:hypothetical protein